MYFNLKFISKDVAQAIFNVIAPLGGPSMDRVLVLSPKEDEIVQGGIIIPGQAKEGRPNKGVVVNSGFISDEYSSYRHQVEIGRIITYGMYAGKEIEFDPQLFTDAGISIDTVNNKFTVLAINEIIYSEKNQN